MGRTRRPRPRASSEITTATNVQIHQRPDGRSPSCEFEGCHSFEAISPTHIFYVYVTLALADSIRGVSHLRNLSHLSICWREKVVQDDKALDNVAMRVHFQTFRGD